jgi:hypothetical protein
MLEQAILDAEQLKEAAIKNAESALLEKYSDQIRSAVDSILEQDEMMGADLPVDLPTEEDATCGCPDKTEDEMEIPLDSLLGEPVADEVVVDFEMGREEAALQEQVEDLDEEIEIDLDALLGESENLEEMKEEMKEEEEETLEEEIEIDEESLNALLEEDDMGMPADAETQEADEAESEAMDALATALAEGDAADVIADILSDTVAEQLKVDFEPTPGGYSDWNHRDAAEAQEAFLARTKDTEIAEDQKEYQDAYKALEGLPMLQENLEKLETENEKYKEAILYLKEKLEEVNLSNAILLYTNRTLDSDSLNERQKNKIVEAISKAGSVNEAKTIFETLQSTIESSQRRRQPKSLSEAAKRKSSLYLPRRQEKVDTSDILRERMMRLAGIKNQ